MHVPQGSTTRPCHSLWASVITTALVALAAASAQASNQIDTTADGKLGSWEGFGAGATNTATYGQTFTVGENTFLNSFSLFLEGPPVNPPLQFKAYVYEWTGVGITGVAMYESGVQAFMGHGNPTDLSAPPFEYSFDTQRLKLSSYGTYVAFISTTNVPNSGSAFAYMPHLGGFSGNPLRGGGFVYSNNGDDFSALFDVWDGFDNEYDVWFKASFSSHAPTLPAIPEPSIFVLALVGVLVVMSGNYKRPSGMKA